MNKSISPLSGKTKKAIELFWRIEKYETNLKELEIHLGDLVQKIPDDEYDEYVEKTSTNVDGVPDKLQHHFK